MSKLHRNPYSTRSCALRGNAHQWAAVSRSLPEAEPLERAFLGYIALAQEFAEYVKSHPRFELVVNPPLNLVCFRHKFGDAINLEIINNINSSGKIYLTSTKLEQKLTLRMSIGQVTTYKIHVQQAWQLICQAC